MNRRSFSWRKPRAGGTTDLMDTTIATSTSSTTTRRPRHFTVNEVGRTSTGYHHDTASKETNSSPNTSSLKRISRHNFTIPFQQPSKERKTRSWSFDERVVNMKHKTSCCVSQRATTPTLMRALNTDKLPQQSLVSKEEEKCTHGRSEMETQQQPYHEEEEKKKNLRPKLTRYLSVKKFPSTRFACHPLLFTTTDNRKNVRTTSIPNKTNNLKDANRDFRRERSNRKKPCFWTSTPMLLIYSCSLLAMFLRAPTWLHVITIILVLEIWKFVAKWMETYREIVPDTYCYDCVTLYLLSYFRKQTSLVNQRTIQLMDDTSECIHHLAQKRYQGKRCVAPCA